MNYTSQKNILFVGQRKYSPRTIEMSLCALLLNLSCCSYQNNCILPIAYVLAAALPIYTL